MSELGKLSNPRCTHPAPSRQMRTSLSFYAAVNNLPQEWVEAVLREFKRAS